MKKARRAIGSLGFFAFYRWSRWKAGHLATLCCIRFLARDCIGVGRGVFHSGDSTAGLSGCADGFNQQHTGADATFADATFAFVTLSFQ